jgi:hypothetical protein
MADNDYSSLKFLFQMTNEKEKNWYEWTRTILHRKFYYGEIQLADLCLQYVGIQIEFALFSSLNPVEKNNVAGRMVPMLVSDCLWYSSSNEKEEEQKWYDNVQLEEAKKRMASDVQENEKPWEDTNRRALIPGASDSALAALCYDGNETEISHQIKRGTQLMGRRTVEGDPRFPIHFIRCRFPDDKLPLHLRFYGMDIRQTENISEMAHQTFVQQFQSLMLEATKQTDRLFGLESHLASVIEKNKRDWDGFDLYDPIESIVKIQYPSDDKEKELTRALNAIFRQNAYSKLTDSQIADMNQIPMMSEYYSGSDQSEERLFTITNASLQLRGYSETLSVAIECIFRPSCLALKGQYCGHEQVKDKVTPILNGSLYLKHCGRFSFRVNQFAILEYY